MHPYDHSVDQDAPGEELEEDDLQSQMKKMTSAQSWKAYRSAKGQGTLKINRTERDETRSRMYEAACRFAVSPLSNIVSGTRKVSVTQEGADDQTNVSETWTPHESWAGAAEEGKQTHH
jgi:hypothetical protein